MPCLLACFPTWAPKNSSLFALQLFLLRRALERGANISPVPALWAKAGIDEFLHAASPEIRDADHFVPWQYLVEVCLSRADAPMPDLDVPVVWRPNLPLLVAPSSCQTAA